MYKGELGTANAHKILLKDIGKLFLPEAPVPHCTSIKQWGYNRTSSITVFPISFSKTCIATYDNGSSTAVRWLDNVYVKLNGIQMSTSGFIAVGI